MVKKTTKKKTTKKTSTSAAAKKTKTTKKVSTSAAVKKSPKPVEEKAKEIQEPKKENLDHFLHLKVSKTLKDKLIMKAKSEGVSLEDFAGELLAEGLVLRAWEIMERKTAMSKGSGNGNSNNHNNNNQNKNRYNNNRHKRNNNNNNRRFNNNNNGNFNGNTMDDKANFMEYLRNQEVQQR